MIPVFLLRNAPMIALWVAVIGAGLLVGHKLKESGRNEVVPLLDKALEERDNLAAALEFERANARKAEEAVDAYTKEIAGLRRVIRDRGPVRVCFSDSDNMPATSAAAENTDGTAATSGGVSGAARGDLAAIRELAYQCDAVSAQLRALQWWLQPQK